MCVFNLSYGTITCTKKSNLCKFSSHLNCTLPKISPPSLPPLTGPGTGAIANRFLYGQCGLGSHQAEGIGFGLEQQGWYCCGGVTLHVIGKGVAEVTQKSISTLTGERTYFRIYAIRFKYNPSCQFFSTTSLVCSLSSMESTLILSLQQSSQNWCQLATIFTDRQLHVHVGLTIIQ